MERITDDVFSSDEYDSVAPISCGIFHVTPGDELLTYTYKYEESKYIISGTIILEEKNTGEKIVGEAGDVIQSASACCARLRTGCLTLSLERSQGRLDHHLLVSNTRRRQSFLRRSEETAGLLSGPAHVPPGIEQPAFLLP